MKIDAPATATCAGASVNLRCDDSKYAAAAQPLMANIELCSITNIYMARRCRTTGISFKQFQLLCELRLEIDASITATKDQPMLPSPRYDLAVPSSVPTRLVVGRSQSMLQRPFQITTQSRLSLRGPNRMFFDRMAYGASTRGLIPMITISNRERVVIMASNEVVNAKYRRRALAQIIAKLNRCQ